MTILTYEYENIRFTCSPMGNQPTDRYVVNARRISDGKHLHPMGKRPGISQARFQSDKPPTQEYFEQICQYKMLEALGNFEPEGTRCFACAAWLEADDDTDYQFDNALWVTFEGGYGMFVDPMRHDDHKAVICHECAHKLCDENPWIEQLLNSFGSHAHRVDIIPGLVAQGHQGWDLTQYHDGTKPLPDPKEET